MMASCIMLGETKSDLERKINLMRDNALLEEVLKRESEIVADVLHIKFENSHHDSTVREYEVKDLADPQVAVNNCFVASDAIVAGTSLAAYFEGTTVISSGIESPAGNHFALLFSRQKTKWTEDSVIVDFSARQYDPEAPFPLVMDAWQWQEWVEGKLGREGTWTHLQDWYLD